MNVKKRLSWWLPVVGIALLTFVLAGCGGGSSTPTMTTTTGSVSTTNGTTAAALSINAPTGVTLSIPANTTFTNISGHPVTGTVSTSVSYSISTADLPAAARTLPANTTALAAFVDISMGTVKYFSNPISLAISVTSSGAKPGDALVVYSFDSSTNQWTFAGTAIVDANGNISPVVTHLSIWAVFKASTPPPVAPAGVTAVAGTSQATVSWSAVTGATSYNVYYSPTAGVTKANATNSLTGQSGTTCTVPSLLNGTPYYFVVTAVSANGESIASDEVSATPLARPSGIQVTAGDSQVTVSWTAAAGATSYNIYYSQASGQETTASGVKLTNQTSPQVIPGLQNGTTYYFVVTAVNATGESVVSSEKSATPAATPQPPASPTGVKVSSPGIGQMSVSWTAVVGATSYNVYYLQAASQPTNAQVLATTPTNTTATSLTVSNLTSGATYYVLVTALNGTLESGTQTSAKAIVIQ